jgi:hypothetical protein
VSIIQYLRQRGIAFDPETTRILNVVLDQVTISLQLDGLEFSRERVADTIIELAQAGDRNPVQLRANALRLLTK